MLHVDHVVEVRDDPSDANFFNPANLVTLCRPHHTAKTLAVGAGRVSGGVEVVRSW